MGDKPNPSATAVYRVMVRYGRMRLLSRFRANFGDLRAGVPCVVKTDRGTEMGEVVSRASEPKGGRPEPEQGPVLRIATEDDQARNRQMAEGTEQETFRYTAEAIRRFGLEMKLSGVEQLFGGERIIFYFVAPKRVDFRELVRDLARRFRTRIEMMQIGVRDEAKLLADYETCGRPLCCKTYMRKMEPVSIKMAKNQGTTLDPAKLAGRCGRLKCCLRHEDAVYKEFRSCLPRTGRTIDTPDGPASVVKTQPLAMNVTVAYKETNTRKTFRAVEVKPDCGACTRCGHAD